MRISIRMFLMKNTFRYICSSKINNRVGNITGSVYFFTKNNIAMSIRKTKKFIKKHMNDSDMLFVLFIKGSTKIALIDCSKHDICFFKNEIIVWDKFYHIDYTVIPYKRISKILI